MKCPFCFNDNACGLGNEQVCWCFTVNVPDDLLALVPLEQKGAVCICSSCVELFCNDKKRFLKTLAIE